MLQAGSSSADHVQGLPSKYRGSATAMQGSTESVLKQCTAAHDWCSSTALGSSWALLQHFKPLQHAGRALTKHEHIIVPPQLQVDEEEGHSYCGQAGQRQ